MPKYSMDICYDVRDTYEIEAPDLASAQEKLEAYWRASIPARRQITDVKQIAEYELVDTIEDRWWVQTASGEYEEID